MSLDSENKGSLSEEAGRFCAGELLALTFVWVRLASTTKMDKMTKSHRWSHGLDYLTSTGDSKVKVPHPSTFTEWVDDMKLWPDVSYVDILNYFVLSEGVDGETLRNYKSTEAYNYLHSNKIGKVLCREYEEFIFLKAEVEHSQSINKSKHLAWVMTRPIGIIETVGCSCITGLGKSCSHAAAVIWKVGIMLRAIFL